MTRPTLTQATGPAHTRILGIGGVRGERVVPNDDLVGPIDSSDEWIRQRTGIVTRRRAERGHRRARPRRGRRAGRARERRASRAPTSTRSSCRRSPTSTRRPPARRSSPTASARRRRRRSTSRPRAPGYCYGIGQADALVRAGTARNVLVIGAEKMSELRRPDRPRRSRSCSATAPARSSSAPPTPPASARPSGARTAARRRRSARRTRGSPRRDEGARLAHAAPGGPERLQVGRLADGARRAEGDGRGGRDGRARSRRSSRTRRTCGSSTR